MKVYSKNGSEPKELPFRIFLEVDGESISRTDPETFTDEEIATAGYVEVLLKPEYNAETQDCSWDANTLTWSITDKSEEQIAIIEAEKLDTRWDMVRKTRDQHLNAIEWRINRYHSEVRQGLTPTDDINKLDTYMQALRDLTKQSDPFNLVWPSLDQDEN